MAKDSRFKFEYRKNASRLHRTVGDLLRSHPNFKHLDSFQEYPVNRVNSSYEHGSHKFDWVLPKIKLVIECHGIQHYKVSTFGAAVENAVEAFHDGQRRDKMKKEAALAAGFRYIVVSYKEEKLVTANLIFGKLKEAEKELEAYQADHEELPERVDTRKEEAKAWQREARQKYLQSDAHKERLERAKQYRREQYLKRKEERS